MSRAPILLLSLLIFPATVGRAQDDVLAVEQRKDERGRDALLAQFSDMRSDFRCEESSPREVCRMFAARTGDRVSFSIAEKDVGDAKVSLDLRQASLATAMAVVQMQTGLRFVYRSGVVFLVPAAAITPLAYVQVYDLRSQFVKLRNFPGPELRLPGSGDDRPLFPEEEETENTVSGLTADGVETMIKENVTPDLFASGAVSLTNSNGMFLARLTPQGHVELRKLLIELGLVMPPRVVVLRREPPPLPPVRRGAERPAKPSPGSSAPHRR